jgi:aspartyl aminopeptidase
VGAKSQPEKGIRLLGAHTDSPVLAVKPQPDIKKEGLLQIGVEVYGGALLNPWFDRDLSVAGRVSFLEEGNFLRSSLVNFSEPIAFIPSLAIHLDRDANRNKNINSQKHILPIMMHLGEESSFDFRAILKRQMEQQHSLQKIDRILDYDLVLYDTQKASYVGLEHEFIASARLDNLLSCYSCLRAMLASDFQHSSLFIFNDHEEVGSASNIGAQGPFLKDVLRRMCGTEEALIRSAQGSVLISTDNAHAVHPNFSDRHDKNHSPRLNDGPVIKVNTNQRYATNSDTAGLFRMLAHSAEVPVQTFVMRTDMRCGSTIGPISATETGISTLDVGVPTLGMHSIRELAGYKDAHGLFQVLRSFLDLEEFG